MKKTTIYFLRHGEVNNPKKILYGRLRKFDLSENGRKQIEEISGKLKNKGITIIYTSPMLRTRQTSKLAGEALRLKPRISKLLNEVRLLFDGMPIGEFKQKYQPKLYNKIYIRKGQESIEEISERMLKFVGMVIKRHEGKTVLTVSHGDPIVILKATILGKKFSYRFKKENYLQLGKYLKLVYHSEKYYWDQYA